MSDSKQVSPLPSPEWATLREISTDAIRYWEPRRVLYNAILACIVIANIVHFWPESRAELTVERAISVFILAVLANVCYTTAYIVDVFAQLSDFRSLWRKIRWILLVIGIAFASALTGMIASD